MVSVLTDLENKKNVWLSQNLQYDFYTKFFILELALILRVLICVLCCVLLITDTLYDVDE